MRLALGGRGEAHTGGGRPRRLVALVAAEDEEDRRQQRALGEQVDRLQPPGRVEHPLPAPPRRSADRAASAHGQGVDAAGVGVGHPVDERRQELQAVVGAVADEVVVVEAHRPARLDDGGRRAPHRLDPRRQLAGVADRGGQAHQPHVAGEVDDHLLPHRAAVGVLEEVHLVEHDEPEVVERRASGRRSCCAAPRWSSPPSARRRRPRCRRSAGRPGRRRSAGRGHGTSGWTAPSAARCRTPACRGGASSRCRTPRRPSCRSPSVRPPRRGGRRRGRRWRRAGSGRAGTGSGRGSRPRTDAVKPLPAARRAVAVAARGSRCRPKRSRAGASAPPAPSSRSGHPTA